MSSPDLLLLQMRLEAAERVLKQVKAIQESIMTAWQGFKVIDNTISNRLEKRVRDFPDDLDRSLRSVGELKNELERLKDVDLYSVGKLEKSLGDAKTAADDIKKYFGDVLEQVGRMHADAIVTGEEDFLQRRLESSFYKAANDRLVNITKIKEEVARIPGLAEAERPAAVADAWRRYLEEFEGEGQELLREYVDVLSGVALRNTRADAGICGMTEALMSPWRLVGGDVDKTVAFPGRYEGDGPGPARIVRLGFPEWTIWAVPLAAYEFGRLVVDGKEEEFQTSWPRRGAARATYPTFLADAFATAVMGPAYACAAIFLRFNPSTVAADPSGPDRAAAVLKTLELMNHDGEFGPIIDDLRAAWSTALEQSGGTDTSKRQGKTIDAAAAAMLDFLKRSPSVVLYDGPSWNRVNGWVEAQPKLEGEFPPREIDQRGPLDIRDVLNAAWRARIDAPHRARPIAERVNTIWTESLAPTTGGGVGTPSGYRIASSEAQRPEAGSNV